MIRRIRVRNFTSHSDTEIEFPERLTILVGRNGAGKSSVIDAITYALYGKTTRGGMRNIVRDGTVGGEVVLEFDYRGRRYKVMRGFDRDGRLLAAALRDGEDRLIASGEREVSSHVEQLLGLSYDRMKSAVIVQQGELDKILNESPADVKMLFDDLLGLSKMERAYENMRGVLTEFEKRVRREVGKSIGEAEQVAEEQRRMEDELKGLQKDVGKLEKEVEDLKKDLEELSRRKEALEEAARLYDEVRKNTIKLAEAVRRRIKDLERAKPYVELLEKIGKDEVERRIKQLEDLRSSRERISQEISRLEGEKKSKEKALKEFEKDREKLVKEGLAEEATRRIRTFEELSGETDLEASKLIRDSIEAGRMLERGVIGEDRLREVEELGVKKVIGLVEGAYSSGRAAWIREISARAERLRGEIRIIDTEIINLRGGLNRLENEIKGLEKYNGRDIQDLTSELNSAERQLTNLGWSGSVQQLESAISLLNEGSQYLERVVGERVMPDRAYLEGLEELLDREGCEILQVLLQSMERLPAELDLGELKMINEKYAELYRQLGEKNSELQVRMDEAAKLQKEIEDLRRVGEELSRAKRFYEMLEEIRDNVFHRDGPVLKSLRTWVYRRVSDRVREYLDMFDVRIDDVRIEESGERGGVRFVCFYGGREVDSDRLSGGEKVALALAIRLAIGDVLGAQRLGFLMLDEPTIHLDSENKKKLREIFASLGDVAGQTIIITHDEELFEDADATMLRFERGPAPDSPTEIQMIRTAHMGSTTKMWSQG